MPARNRQPQRPFLFSEQLFAALDAEAKASGTSANSFVANLLLKNRRIRERAKSLGITLPAHRSTLGPKPTVDRAKVMKLYGEGFSQAEISRKLECSKSTVQRIVSGEST